MGTGTVLRLVGRGQSLRSHIFNSKIAVKKYIANSVVSLSAILANGKSTRISFSPLSDGRSMYLTADPDIQWALEHHSRFGKLFQLVECTQDKKTVFQKKIPAKTKNTKGRATANIASKEPVGLEEVTVDEMVDAEIDDEVDTIGEGDTHSSYKVVEVSDMETAKDYLAENFEVVRTKLKTEGKIKETALAFGIVFKYL